MKPSFSKPWATAQQENLLQQMRRGVRVLDFRLGCDGPNEWILVHDKWRTMLSLEEALAQTRKFVQSHPSEVIILDFHRFLELKHRFRWTSCSNLSWKL